MEPPSGNLLEALEKLVGICVPKAIALEIKDLAGCELFLSHQQTEHSDDFGGLDVGDAVYQFVGFVEALPHDSAGVSRVFYGQRSEKWAANAVDLVQPDHRRVENICHKLPFDVYGVGFIEPDVKGRLHSRFAAALVVFEFMNDHRMGIKQELVKRVLAYKGGIGDNGGVSGIFHASEIRFSHADGPIGIALIFIVLGCLDPEDRFFEDFHRDLHLLVSPEEQGIRDRRAAIVVDYPVPENVPRTRAGDKKVRGHRNGVIEGDDLPVGLTGLANGNERRVGSGSMSPLLMRCV